MHLGNLNAKRDWGHAKDFVKMQWLMLQADTPEDFVIATGVQYSVRQFVEAVADRLGMPIEWTGIGIEEVGKTPDGETIIQVDPRYFRPTEVETLLGDYSKARNKLGWMPKTNFEQLVKEMVEEDLKLAEKELIYTQG